MNKPKAASLPKPDFPQKRWLFAVDVQAKGQVIYSVAGDTEQEAFDSLTSQDAKKSVLVYDDMEILPQDKPVKPQSLGIDQLYAKRRRYAQ